MRWVAEHKIGIWAFAVAVAFIPGIMSAAILPRWAVIMIGAPLVSRLSLDRLSQAMQYVLVLGLSWAACSILVSPDPMNGALLFFFMVAIVGAFLAASELETIDDAMTGLALGVGVSSIVCLLYLAGVQVASQATPNPAGLFYNSEVLAEFAAPVFLWTVISKRWPLAAMTFVPVAVCNSRIALLVVAVGLLYAYWPRSRLLGVSLVVALFVCASVALVALGQGKINTAGLRVVVWLATLLAATPLGNGLGWFEAAHPAEQFAHSDAIQAINELGLGSVFLAAIPVLILRSNRGTNAERAVFIAICVEAIVSFPLHVPGTAFVAALVAGYLAGSRTPVFVGRPERRDRNAKNYEWAPANGAATYG
jgi:hypothetical protein